MGKIFLLVGIAIVVFMLFTAYSVQKEIQGSVQLKAIKDLYFPVLQRLDADIVRVDKIEETYIEAVITGDHDLTDKAADIGKDADQALAEIATLYPARAEQTAKLRAGLKSYQKLAVAAVLAFQAQNTEQGETQRAAMNQTLGQLREGLKTFRASSYAAFEQVLAGSEHDARVRLLMGLALGVMNLCFMAVLVYFIRNNVRMMTIIAEQNATLEQRVAERTAQLSQKTSDINAMLQNMKLGVSTVVSGNSIHPEYSNYLRAIFDVDDVAGKDLMDSLFVRSKLGVDSQDQVRNALGAILGEDAMMFDLNGHLLPGEMQLDAPDGKRKTVQMEWSPIVNEQGSVEKVLFITQDVTHLRELELSSAAQKEELDIIARLIRIPAGKFNEFIGSSQKFIAANRTLLQSTSTRDPEAIAALFRNMHTIKGNARTFEFVQVTNVAHLAEQTYDRLRKDENSPWQADLMLSELDAVEAEINRYVRVSEDTLGRKGRAADMLTARGAFVAAEELEQLKAKVAAVAAANTQPEIAELRGLIERLGFTSLQRIVSSSTDALNSLAQELNKPVPEVDIVDGNIAFTRAFAAALKSSFMHILRNSLDHGIETPAERMQAHKPESGRIHFKCVQHSDRVELRIGDDGRGLPLHKLYEKALAAGVMKSEVQPRPQDVAELIFRSGLSTAAQVTQVSGRGVGMDAVRTFLTEQGARIGVSLRGPQAGLAFTPFEFVIDVPSAAYSAVC